MTNVPPLGDLWWHPSMAHAIKCWARGAMGILGTDSAIRKYNHVDGSINYVKTLQCCYISDT